MKRFLSWVLLALVAVAGFIFSSAPAQAGGPATVYISTGSMTSGDIYFWHVQIATAIWNAKPAATNVTLVNIGSQACPSINTASCILIDVHDFGNQNICGATTRSTIGAHSYASVSINSECWYYSEYQRTTIVVHELGHGLGVGGNNDPNGACNIMSDTSSCVYNFQIPDEFVLDEVAAQVN